MMTISRLSAGSGYEYYVSITASGDQRRSKTRELGDYYLDTGTPEGVWMGRGAAHLGIEGHVTESQMRALFGEGLHPNAEPMISDLIEQGLTAKQAIRKVRLGRAFPTHDPKTGTLARAITDEITRREKPGQPLSADERRAIRMQEANKDFIARNGRSGSRQEVAKHLARELSKTSNAVAGFDLTFSAPKSLSVAWGLADPADAAHLEAAHERAIQATLTMLERDVIRARTGAGGIAWHTTHGLLATRFRHWESREGDPQLHDHVVIANRVAITTDGQERWLTIDSRSLYKATINASSVYNRVLADELKHLGFALRTRTTPSGKYQGMELACVADPQLDQFAARSAAIAARTNDLVAEYVDHHGRQPGTKELLALRQQATLDTRVPKSKAVTRDELRASWATQLGTQAHEISHAVREALHGISSELSNSREPTIDVAAVAHHVISDLSHKQSVWTINHVETRINMWAAAQPAPVTDDLLREIRDYALTTAGFPITPAPAPVPYHPELVNTDGGSIYTPPAATLYTSRAVLEAEDTLLRAAHQVALPAVRQRHFDKARRSHNGPLDQGQVDLAYQVTCAEQKVTVGIGPAGTGKTTAMRLAIAAARAANVTVHGITVSAAAAEQLQQATDNDACTIAKWLRDLETGQRRINRGDIILVDEAGMVSARDLACIVDHATTHDAVVRLVGDDRQLQAIGAGGSIKMLAAEVGCVRLDQVHRFTDPDSLALREDEAQASLALRETGDVTWYLDHGRVHGATRTHVIDQIVLAWASDEAAGQPSLMMASTNADVALLNEAAQTHLLSAGTVNHTRTVTLADGCIAGVGDRVVTRRNDRTLPLSQGYGFVKNGDIWTVTALDSDGGLTVTDAVGRTTTLPTDYVAAYTGLGYASTVHRAQGQTVDHARLLVDATTTREALYVGLTRGRSSNEAYVALEGQSAANVVREAGRRTSQAQSARELIDQAQAEADHPAHLVRILRDMQQRADEHRYRTTISQLLPTHAEQLLHSDQKARLFAALARAEDAGFSPQHVLELCARHLPDHVQDLSGILTWRINQHLTKANQHAHTCPPRPLRHLSPTQLGDMLDALPEQRAYGRVHARLTDAELADQLHHTRTRAHLASQATLETRAVQRELRREARRLPDGNTQRQALLNRADRLEQRIGRLDRDHRLLVTAEVSLRAETRHRVTSSAELRHHEHQHRETTPRFTNWAQARHVRREAWRELRMRDLDPDLTPHRPGKLPAWAVPCRGLDHPATPRDWIQPLTDMATRVADAIYQRGAAIALDPPTWATRSLGPVPPAETAQRLQWEKLAGQIETWRGLTDHHNPSLALPRASRSHDASPRPTEDLVHLTKAMATIRSAQHQQKLDQLREETLRLHPEPPRPLTPTAPPALPQPSQPGPGLSKVKRLVLAARSRALKAATTQRRQELLTAPLRPGEDLIDRLRRHSTVAHTDELHSVSKSVSSPVHAKPTMAPIDEIRATARKTTQSPIEQIRANAQRRPQRYRPGSELEH